MNIKASCWYQIEENKKGIAIYYFVVACVAVVTFLSTPGGVQMNGFDFATVIFLFVVGLCSFKDNFGMLMQNSVTRKTIFFGRLATTAGVALGMAVADKIFQIIINLLFTRNGNPFYENMYEQFYAPKLGYMSSFGIIVESFLLSFFLYLALSMVGYMITILFYRLGKGGKIAVGVGVPVTWCVIVPILDFRFFDGRLSMLFSRFADFSFGITEVKPQNAMITCLLLFIFTAIISWLLMRKAVVRE